MPQRNIPADVFSMTQPITGSPSETPRQAARRETILEIARESFLSDGYAATSMSSIAARLGGSKGTLYNYYPSKEELFGAVMQYHCAGARTTFEELLAQTGDLRERLQRFGEAYQTVVFSDVFLAVHRLVTGESGRFPELGVSALAQEASSTALDEIVVTAERRSENLQKVPVSVAVVGGDQLRAIQGGGDTWRCRARSPASTPRPPRAGSSRASTSAAWATSTSTSAPRSRCRSSRTTSCWSTWC
jgi:AcrR family transcriptional regulator